MVLVISASSVELVSQHHVGCTLKATATQTEKSNYFV